MVGQKLAAKLGVKSGDIITGKDAAGRDKILKVSGILSGGGAEEEQIVAPLKLAQDLTDRAGRVSSVEVSAITTPENDLARKAAANPKALSQREYDIWYCTAYVGSIAFQIEEVIPGSVARPVRQIAESEGKILDKTQLLMLLITVLNLLSATLGVSNLISTNVSLDRKSVV